jgi:hypothetical protein
MVVGVGLYQTDAGDGGIERIVAFFDQIHGQFDRLKPIGA